MYYKMTCAFYKKEPCIELMLITRLLLRFIFIFSCVVFLLAFPKYQAEAVQRLHFANNAVRIRMLGCIKSRRQKD